MRASYRNQQVFWYATYGDSQPIFDEWGNEIGYGVTYGKPTRTRGNISPARGAVAARQFGDDVQYDKVIGPLPIDTAIDEHSVLWLDVTPAVDAEGNIAEDSRGQMVTPYNYRVVQVAKSLPTFGGVMIAVKAVNVS